MSAEPDEAAATAPRPIRSFVRRAGRIGPGQQRALSELGPRFVLPFRPSLLTYSPVTPVVFTARGAGLPEASV